MLLAAEGTNEKMILCEFPYSGCSSRSLLMSLRNKNVGSTQEIPNRLWNNFANYHHQEGKRKRLINYKKSKIKKECSLAI